MADARDELTVINVGGQTSIDLALGWHAHTVYVENYSNQYVSLPDIVSFVPPYTARLLALPGVQKAKMLFASPPGLIQVSSVAGQVCTATWSERSVPVTGGPIGPIGVTSNYYDRNPLSLVQTFTAQSVGVHGTTVRWAYTVPANRKAFLESGQVATQIMTALTGPQSTAESAIAVTPVAGGRVSVIDALIGTASLAVGVRADVALGASIELQPGDLVQGITLNGFTGGTCLHLVNVKLTEFDA